MESGPGPSEFRRLIEEHGTVGELLRAADAEYRDRLDEPRAFRELERRRLRRTTIRSAAGLVALAALGVLGFQLHALPNKDAPPELATAEPSAPPSPIASVVPTTARPPEVRSPRPAVEVEVARPERRTLSRFVEPPPQRVDCSAAVGADGSALGVNERSVPDTLRLRCYQELAQGSGVSSETALYELARLSVARGEKTRALEFLSEHQRRFPSGALRGEVAELRISTLYELGRDREALTESELALTRPWGRVLSAKLHFLRGKIYEERLHDCERALSEYVALVGATTPNADDAEFRRARCYERLTRHVEARSAYQQYLERAAPVHKAAAQQRLDALSHSLSLDGPGRPSGPSAPSKN